MYTPHAQARFTRVYTRTFTRHTREGSEPEGRDIDLERKEGKDGRENSKKKKENKKMKRLTSGG